GDHEWKAWTWLVIPLRNVARAPRPRALAMLHAARAWAPAPHGLQALARDVVDQVAHAVGVSPLIVIPGDHLHAVAADHHGPRRIDNRRAWVALEIRRHQFMLLVSQVALQRPGF